MIKHTIYFQDLKEDTQAALWQAVERELLACGDVEYWREAASEEEFAQRLQDEADHYINCHKDMRDGFQHVNARLDTIREDTADLPAMREELRDLRTRVDRLEQKVGLAK